MPRRKLAVHDYGAHDRPRRAVSHSTSVLPGVDMSVPSLRILFTALPIVSIAAWPAGAEPQVRLAQAQIQIPSDAQLDRMEQQGIEMPPLYDGGAGATDGGIAAENRQMEEQAHRIDEKLLSGGICSGCERRANPAAPAR